MSEMMRSKPHAVGFGRLLAKTSVIAKKKLRTVSECLDALTVALARGAGASKCIDLATKISQIEVEETEIWVTDTINKLIEACESSETWFSGIRSTPVLFIANIAAGTVQEEQLRVVCDYALSKFTPMTEHALTEHMRIAAVFIQTHHANHSHFLSGAAIMLRRVIYERDGCPFEIPRAVSDSACRLLTELSRFPAVNHCLPEMIGSAAEPPGLAREAVKAEQQRIEEYLKRRVYPPMIQTLKPQVEYVPKFKTEEDRLRDKLKRAKREAKRTEKEVALNKMSEMREAKTTRREESERTRKEVITMLEAHRNDDLNMAAAPAKEDGEEEDGEEESSSSE